MTNKQSVETTGPVSDQTSILAEGRFLVRDVMGGDIQIAPISLNQAKFLRRDYLPIGPLGYIPGVAVAGYGAVSLNELATLSGAAALSFTLAVDVKQTVQSRRQKRLIKRLLDGDESIELSGQTITVEELGIEHDDPIVVLPGRGPGEISVQASTLAESADGFPGIALTSLWQDKHYNNSTQLMSGSINPAAAARFMLGEEGGGNGVDRSAIWPSLQRVSDAYASLRLAHRPPEKYKHLRDSHDRNLKRLVYSLLGAAAVCLMEHRHVLANEIDGLSAQEKLSFPYENIPGLDDGSFEAGLRDPSYAMAWAEIVDLRQAYSSAMAHPAH